MPFTCVDCECEFLSEYVPARDMRTGGDLCPECDEERKNWRARMVFLDPTDCAGDCGYHVHGWEV